MKLLVVLLALLMASPVQAAYNAGPKPGKWCGWWMRTQLGGGPQYNLARKFRSMTESTGN